MKKTVKRLKKGSLTPACYVTNKLLPLISVKMAEQSEAKRAKHFEAKLRYILLASLRSAISRK